MEEPAEAVIMAGQGASPVPTPAKRLTRVARPSTKVREVTRQLEDTADRTKRSTRLTTSVTSSEVTTNDMTERRRLGSNSGSNGVNEGRAMLQMALDLLSESRQDIQRLSRAVIEQNEIITGQRQMIHELDRQGKETGEEVKYLRDELRQVRAQLETVATPATSIHSSPQVSYADAARTSPFSQPLNHGISPSIHPTPSTVSDSLYCTIGTSRVDEADKTKAQIGSIRKAIEGDIRNKKDYESWRDEAELKRVKEVAEKTVDVGARVMRDQLFPIKIDNANHTAVLDGEGNVLPGAAEALGAENNVTIAKISWLSKKERGKAYGSMVIYATKESDAKRLLDGVYFDLAGESAYTNVFERRLGPIHCFNCQEIGHKAFSCKKPQTCGRCAKAGHHHRECKEIEPKFDFDRPRFSR
ncbi:hypothetical protein RJ55_06812 [Drechmeria coniospora]|nr:hypothetical protein RJ55_06812 [Drechmeria coniospora]